jgi:endonuclease/exonuclease/phosphatase family metal-dependent hydrolase
LAKSACSIVKYLNKENPDILLLQEVRFNLDLAYHNQATELNEHLQSSYTYESVSISHFYRPSVGKPYREGLAILSHKPLLKSETLALTQATDDKHVRLMQNADIQLEDQNIKVSNVHFSNNNYSSQQLEEVMRVLTKREEKPIIAGDFNIFDISEHEKLYKGYSVSVDFSNYVSFPSEGKTIDYMLLPDKYEYQSITATEGLSDHAALSYVVSLKP